MVASAHITTSVAHIIKTLTFYFFIATAVFLTVTSIIVRDTAFIVNQPRTFLIELLFIAVLPTLMYVFILTETRYVREGHGWRWIMALMLKFAGLHAAMQLSGIYSVYFSRGGVSGA